MNAPLSRAAARGFTLLEIMVVVVIIATLAAILLPSLAKSQLQKKKLLAQQHVKAIREAAELYQQELGQYPPDTDDYGTGDKAEEFFDPEAVYKYLGREIEDKKSGRKLGPFMTIQREYLKDQLYVDPWGLPYHMDCQHTRISKGGPNAGEVEIIGAPYKQGTLPEKQTLNVKSWSSGPDLKWQYGSNADVEETPTGDDADNVRSW